MKAFAFIRRVNHIAAVISGIFIVIMSFLCSFEAVARNVFSRPTTWTLDISSYFLIYAFFLASAAAIQEKTHVSVDFIRNMIRGKFGEIWGRVLSISGYVFCLVFILVLLGTMISFTGDALRFNKLTLAVVQIPLIYLYVAALGGCILMMVVVIFIVLDLLRGSDEYL
jgi:C4-dicarboxylate transporter DctQ subunit